MEKLSAGEENSPPFFFFFFWLLVSTTTRTRARVGYACRHVHAPAEANRVTCSAVASSFERREAA